MNRFMIIFLIMLFCYSLYKDINIIDVYIEGVKGALKLIVPIFTTMMAFLLFVTLFKECGLLELLDSICSPYLPLPFQIVVIGLLRPISANVSLSYLYTLYNRFGVDHIYCLFATIIQCSSDTTLYVINLYFSSINRKDTQYSVMLGFFMDFLAFFISLFIFLKMIV